MANEKGRSILTKLDYRVHHKASKPIRQNFWASLEVEGGEGLWDFVVEQRLLPCLLEDENADLGLNFEKKKITNNIRDQSEK